MSRNILPKPEELAKKREKRSRVKEEYLTENLKYLAGRMRDQFKGTLGVGQFEFPRFPNPAHLEALVEECTNSGYQARCYHHQAVSMGDMDSYGILVFLSEE